MVDKVLINNIEKYEIFLKEITLFLLLKVL